MDVVLARRRKKIMNYTESKKKINAIRDKYGCKGEVIFRTAIQYVMEVGQATLNGETWFQKALNEINNKHDAAEAEGKLLFTTRDFERAILECAKELAEINTYDLLTYIQREVWLGGGEVGEPDYQRAIQIIRNCLCYTVDSHGADDCSNTLYRFRELDLTDDEIVYFGWEYLLDAEDEEDY
jgi:hypothetical protein